ncbi:probable RNA-directed DNA polymerase from transposon BS [Trichonephila clavipes]|nr:probable RNA-directed DNA polymerase from transposon BS [Trichonephila clavipes]
MTQLVKKKFWNFKKANWENYRDTVDRGLLSKPPIECRSIDDLDESWLSFKKIIFKAAGQAIPRGNYKRSSPFFMHKSPLLQPMLKKRVDICREIKKSNNPSLRSSLNKINAEIKRTFIHLKREKWKELCKSIDAHTPNTKLWKLMKSLSITQPQQEECNTIIDDNGHFSSDNKTSANLLGSYYQKTSKLTFNAMDKDTENYARKLVHGCRSSEHGIPIFKEFFTMQELIMALSNLDPSKSPRPDNIHGQMISRLSDWGKKSLLEIFNLSWRLGRLPSYGKIILERLTYYLNSNDLLSIEQYGFKRGHSTADQILYFGQRVRDYQNLRPSHHTVAVFLDLSKAFDRVWRNKLIIKLFNTFGIRDRALSWIFDFLKDREIRVRFRDSLSKTFRLSQGVPQGSVLSPLLFSLYIAGIEKIISRRFFAEQHKLIFNVSKSTSSFFKTNRRLYNYQPQIFIESKSLPYEKHPKYLSYILDPEILSNKHIDYVINKGRKRLDLLKSIADRDWGADAGTLRLTYTSLIRPVLEYGSQIYFSASRTNLAKLDRVQSSAARIITGMRHSCPTDLVLFEADIMPLDLRRKLLLSKYFCKLYSYGDYNRTYAYLITWTNRHRLKRDSPFSRMQAMDLLDQDIEEHIFDECI